MSNYSLPQILLLCPYSYRTTRYRSGAAELTARLQPQFYPARDQGARFESRGNNKIHHLHLLLTLYVFPVTFLVRASEIKATRSGMARILRHNGTLVL
jgi:hypothetical protein